MKLKRGIYLFLTTLLVFPFTALASSVSAIRNNQVIITMDTETYEVGQVVYGMTGVKKTALIQIEKIKGNKALGLITRGHVAVGGGVMIRSAPAPKPSETQEESQTNEKFQTHKRKKYAAGVLLGYATQTANMTVQSATTSESAKFTGSAFSIKGFIDDDYSPKITFRGAFGLEPLQTKGTTSNILCSNGTNNNCTFSYNFLTLEGSAHYNFKTTPIARYWAGLGYAFLIDGGHTNTTPNVQLVGSSSQMVLISFGADFNLKKNFIPVVLEYGMFPGGGGISVSSIFLRAGYGWEF